MVNERNRQVERVQRLQELVPQFEDLSERAPAEFMLVNHTRYLVRTAVGKMDPNTLKKADVQLFLFK